VSRRAPPEELVGFRALGRHGDLGVVVDVVPSQTCSDESQLLVVRGGVSDGLVYFVSTARALGISAEHRTVCFDLDLTDFVPRLADDGTVELRSVG
jgi:hypothetical protein